VGATIHPTARPSRCAPRARSDVRVRCPNRLGRRGSPQPASKDPWRARPTPSSPSTATCSTTRRRSRDGRGHAPRPGNRHRRVQPLRGRRRMRHCGLVQQSAHSSDDAGDGTWEHPIQRSPIPSIETATSSRASPLSCRPTTKKRFSTSSIAGALRSAVSRQSLRDHLRQRWQQGPYAGCHERVARNRWTHCDH
jgi:hypothetical protein